MSAEKSVSRTIESITRKAEAETTHASKTSHDSETRTAVKTADRLTRKPTLIRKPERMIQKRDESFGNNYGMVARSIAGLEGPGKEKISTPYSIILDCTSANLVMSTWLGHGCSGWAMRALVSERIRPWTSSWLGHGWSILKTPRPSSSILSWLGHGCSLLRTQSTMDVILALSPGHHHIMVGHGCSIIITR